MPLAAIAASLLTVVPYALSVTIPTTAPSSAVSIDPASLGVSLEFFALPNYTSIASTANCLANIASLRGVDPPIRIGGTTQDRALYDPNLNLPVNYSVASPADAPLSLTYGPSYFTLVNQLRGDITLGLNRRLNQQSNTLAAGVQAKRSITNLFSIELGNEPEFYAAGSPIIPSSGWNPSADGASQRSWFTALAPTLGNIFQGAVYLQVPTWSTRGLVPLLSSAISNVKTFSGHSYPQSACGGASTNLANLMSHSGIVSYTTQYKSEAAAAHNAGKKYFLGETNSATCGGGGISPTFGAALWIIDYVLQGILNNVDRMYFHQGTVSNCQYCWWGRFTVGAPYYGAAFVAEFLASDGARLAMLDNGSGPVATYAVFNSANAPVRLLVYNSNYYDGSGTRSMTTVSFSGGGIPSSGSKTAKRFTAQNATSRVDQGGIVTIGGGGTFSSTCTNSGTQTRETITASGGSLSVSVKASEALIIYL